MFFCRALQAASQNGHLEVIKVLLRYKADVEIEVSARSSSFYVQMRFSILVVRLALTFEKAITLDQECKFTPKKFMYFFHRKVFDKIFFNMSGCWRKAGIFFFLWLYVRNVRKNARPCAVLGRYSKVDRNLADIHSGVSVTGFWRNDYLKCFL